MRGEQIQHNEQSFFAIFAMSIYIVKKNRRISLHKRIGDAIYSFFLYNNLANIKK